MQKNDGKHLFSLNIYKFSPINKKKPLWNISDVLIEQSIKILTGKLDVGPLKGFGGILPSRMGVGGGE